MDFYLIAILISFIASLTGLALVKEFRTPVLLCFSFFLLISFSVEYIGNDMSMRNKHTASLYNYFTLFEFIFYLFFFRALFTNPRIKKIILFSSIFYFIITLLNILFLQGRTTFHTYTYVLGCTLIVLFSIMYFYSLLKFPEKGTLTKNPFFWIVSGLMFYYTCTFSLYGLNNFIAETMQQYSKNLFLISDTLNLLLYTSFSIGFLCKINIPKLLGLS
ncbi:MAG: hypothetical protein ABIR15_10845 [Chitinophagaceae bacterium]